MLLIPKVTIVLLALSLFVLGSAFSGAKSSEILISATTYGFIRIPCVSARYTNLRVMTAMRPCLWFSCQGEIPHVEHATKGDGHPDLEKSQPGSTRRL